MSQDHPVSAGMTLADVAREAQLSVPTVSRALRNHPDVSEETRNRVQALAAALGYRTSAAARALRTGRHDAISLVLSYQGFGWWEPLLKGASREAARQGFQILLTPAIDDDPTGAAAATGKGLAKVFEYSAALPVDGFIVVTPEGDDWKEQTDRPIVIIDDQRSHPGYHVLLSDNLAGARSATQHLIQQGRKNIVAVAPGYGGAMIDERIEGYRKAAEAAGLPTRVLHSSDVYPPALETSDVVDELIASGEHFDAVFALADHLTFAIFRSLRRNDLEIPHDVAVVGFDDDVTARATDPMLTTVAQPLGDLGARAVDLLIRLLREEQPPEPSAHLLPTHLVCRGSA